MSTGEEEVTPQPSEVDLDAMRQEIMQAECPTSFEEVFDEFDFTYTTKDGKVREACLREMSGGRREAFLTANAGKLEKDGMTVRDYKNIQGVLLTQVFWWKDTQKYATLDEFGKMPAKMLDPLYVKAIQMNGLGKKASEQAKNG